MHYITGQYIKDQYITDQYIADQLYGPQNMSLKMRFFWTAVFFGPATYFGYQGDYIAAAMLSVGGFGAFTGYRTGAFSMVASLVAITAAICCAPEIGMTHSYRFTEWFGTTGLANRFLAIGLVGLAIGVFVMFILWMILGRMFRRRPVLARLNRRTGFVLGMTQAVAGLVFFIGGILVMEPIETARAENRDSDDTRGQLASRLVLSTAAATKQSCLGEVLVRYNPLTQFPQLNKIQQFNQTAEVLSDPVKIQSLIDAPEIAELRQKPEVQRLVSELQSDPKVSEMLQSGGPVNAEMAMTLLNHPAVMHLIDTPGFMEQAAAAMRNAMPKPGMVK